VVIPLAAVMIYGVLYPEDLRSIVAPIGILLALSQEVALGAYLLMSVVAVCITWGCMRCCVPCTTPPAPPDTPAQSSPEMIP
jgi:hypothetical protein